MLLLLESVPVAGDAVYARCWELVLDTRVPRRAAARACDRRLAVAFHAYGLADGGGRALDAYDRWIGMIGAEPACAELACLRRDSVDASEAFASVRRAGDELEAGLLALLFETPLVVLIREYGVFCGCTKVLDFAMTVQRCIKPR